MGTRRIMTGRVKPDSYVTAVDVEYSQSYMASDSQLEGDVGCGIEGVREYGI